MLWMSGTRRQVSAVSKTVCHTGTPGGLKYLSILTLIKYVVFTFYYLIFVADYFFFVFLKKMIIYNILLNFLGDSWTLQNVFGLRRLGRDPHFLLASAEGGLSLQRLSAVQQAGLSAAAASEGDLLPLRPSVFYSGVRGRVLHTY